ncbi:MAG: hypothetical protein LBS22_04110 [Puniceicoccales bacterium]|nr:hypothetical protein [Puniceicoccales bacterium]
MKIISETHGQQALDQIPASIISSTMADFPKPNFDGRRVRIVSPFSGTVSIPVQMPNGAVRFVTPADMVKNKKFLSIFMSKVERRLGSARFQKEIVASPDDPRAKDRSIRELNRQAPMNLNGKYYDWPAICKLLLSYPVVAGQALAQSGR